ncbi:MAG: glycoside hydrolase family 127 protein [Lachnospiraceae bacterium]
MKKYDRLPLTEIKPSGWLYGQLKIQMNGLSGKLYEIWDSVGSYSGWLGGTGDSWERVPYYLDGLLPLSYYLDDKEHWNLCMRFIEWTLGSQDETGNFGPRATWEEQWSRFAMLKVLIQYAEITGDGRVLPFAENYLQYVEELVTRQELISWSRARVPELLYVGKWIYEQTGEEKILECMKNIDQSSIDWCDYLRDLPFPRPAKEYIYWDKVKKFEHLELEEMCPYHETHIVNVTMGFKHPALRALLCDDQDYARIAREGIQNVIRKHGVASGCINGDEHLAGNHPSQGSELCSVTEYMFSLQPLIEVFGDVWYGDLMERLAYNALPATITEDFMGHQYLQQANQIIVDDTKRPWFNNDTDSTVFGLEPNFGCCTANMHQGWPKFVNALWYREGEHTLVNMVLAPSSVDTTLAGERISLRLETDYPFREQLTYRLEDAPGRPVRIKIRIPSWCKEPQVECEGGRVVFEEEGHFAVVEKEFRKGDQIQVHLEMKVTASFWHQDTLAVERGPLVYGLDLQERWEVKKETAGVKDYYIFPESAWNYALDKSLPHKVEEQEVSAVPFSKKHPPVRLNVSARRVEEWKERNGDAREIPNSPVREAGEEETVALIPFGCTKLRISQFPYYESL